LNTTGVTESSVAASGHPARDADGAFSVGPASRSRLLNTTTVVTESSIAASGHPAVDAGGAVRVAPA